MWAPVGPSWTRKEEPVLDSRATGYVEGTLGPWQMQLPQSGWRKALTHVQMVLVGVIQDLMAQPPNIRSKEKKNRYEQEEVKCVMACVHGRVHFPSFFLVKGEDRNSQSMIAKAPCPQAQASPQSLEHPEEQQGEVNPPQKCPTPVWQSSSSPRKHVLALGEKLNPN